MRADSTLRIPAAPSTYNSSRYTKNLVVWLSKSRRLRARPQFSLAGLFRHIDSARIGLIGEKYWTAKGGIGIATRGSIPKIMVARLV